MSNGDVGYKKPPKHSRFKKGQSGNRSGRPKKERLPNLQKTMKNTLMDDVTVTENGRTAKITKLDAMLKQLINKAAGGHMPSIKLALSLLERMPTVANAEAEWEARAKEAQLLRDRINKRLNRMREVLLKKETDAKAAALASPPAEEGGKGRND
jgi:hypothetical protein